MLLIYLIIFIYSLYYYYLFNLFYYYRVLSSGNWYGHKEQDKGLQTTEGKIK